MTYKKYIIILFLLYSQFCFTQNLIQNGSFEDSFGNPSLTGWFTGNNSSYDSTGMGYVFSADVPIGGGQNSIRLATPLFIKYNMSWYLTGIQGTYIYKLSIWAKQSYFYAIQGPRVTIALGLIDSTFYSYVPPTFPTLKKGVICDTVPDYWSQIILIDTFSTQYTDTIAVVLTPGFTMNGPPNYAYYDLVELTVTDTLTSIQNTIHLQDSEIEIFPNPFNDYTTIEFKNKKHNHIQLTLFTITGQVIRKIETSEEHIFIERGELSDGMYFYQLKNYNNGELLGRGKLVLQ